MLTDSNSLCRFQLQNHEETPIQFAFKVSGMDVSNDLVLIYGKADIILYNFNSNTQISLKQNESASDFFGCFNQNHIVSLSSPNNTFKVHDLEGQTLYQQDISNIFQSAVRDFSCNHNNMFIINSKDRALRVFELKYPYNFELLKEIGDYIERKR